VLWQWWSATLDAAAAVVACSIHRDDAQPGRTPTAFVFQGYVAANDYTITPSGSSQYSGGFEAIVNAFDGRSSHWTSSGAALPQWIQAQIPGTVHPITSYTLRVDDANRRPKDWTLQGSSDGTTWTTLDTQTGQTLSLGVLTTFTFTNTTSWLYYRLNVTATQSWDGYVQVADFLLEMSNPYGNPDHGWDTLDTQAGLTWPTVGETKTFSLSNATAYSTYRILINAVDDWPGGGGYVDLTEVGFTYASAPVPPRRPTIVASQAAQRASRW
jgi:hypothetical protein